MPVAASHPTSGGGGEGRNPHHAPTVKEIISDQLTRISLEYWAVGSSLPRKPFESNIIEDIYSKELSQRRAAKIMLLELSNYLEKYPFSNSSFFPFTFLLPSFFSSSLLPSTCVSFAIMNYAFLNSLPHLSMA
jgi:hypothetical protein